VMTNTATATKKLLIVASPARAAPASASQGTRSQALVPCKHGRKNA
jgi:hypothetical protein